MCQLCVDAIKQYWPNLPESDYGDLLMGATSYPFSYGEQTALEIKEMAEESGCDLGMAMAISDTKLVAAMKNAERLDFDDGAD